MMSPEPEKKQQDGKLSVSWRLPSDVQPDPPRGGIPAYRTRRWFRVALRILVLPWMILDLAIQSVVRKIWPPPYRIEGSCKQRGNCCHYILMEWDTWMEKLPWLGRFWMWWYTQIHGFYARGFDVENVDGRVARVMGCRHLQPDGRCAEYSLRPAICRQWPRITYTSQPHVLKGCGYQVVAWVSPQDGADVGVVVEPGVSSQTPVSQPVPDAEVVAGENVLTHDERQEAIQRVQKTLGLKENVQKREE